MVELGKSYSLRATSNAAGGGLLDDSTASAFNTGPIGPVSQSGRIVNRDPFASVQSNHETNTATAAAAALDSIPNDDSTSAPVPIYPHVHTTAVAPASGSDVAPLLRSSSVRSVKPPPQSQDMPPLLLALVSLIVGLAESARGIVIPTLSLYLTSLGGSGFLLGLTVALFSVGRFVASYAFGWLLDRTTAGQSAIIKRVMNLHPKLKPAPVPKADSRVAFSVSLFAVILGHMIYITAQPAHSVALVMISRLAAGFGTGVLAVARTLISQYTTPKSRVKYMAGMGIVQYAGFAVTPILGAQPVHFNIGKLEIDLYTFGSFLLLITTLALAAVVSYLSYIQTPSPMAPVIDDLSHLLNRPPVVVATQPIMIDGATPPPAAAAPIIARARTNTTTSQAPASPPASQRMLWLLILFNTGTRGSLAIFETFGALAFYAVLGHDDPHKVQKAGEFFLYAGAIGLVSYLFADAISKRMGEVMTLCVGMGCFVGGFMILVDFKGGSDLGFPRLWVGVILLWSIGSSLTQVVILSLFSKHLQINPSAAVAQGKWMGQITAGGSVGRVVFPIVGGALVGSIESGGVFLLIGVFQAILFGLAVLYRRELDASVALEAMAAAAGSGSPRNGGKKAVARPSPAAILPDAITAILTPSNARSTATAAIVGDSSAAGGGDSKADTSLSVGLLAADQSASDAVVVPQPIQAAAAAATTGRHKTISGSIAGGMTITIPPPSFRGASSMTTAGAVAAITNPMVVSAIDGEDEHSPVVDGLDDEIAGSLAASIMAATGSMSLSGGSKPAAASMKLTPSKPKPTQPADRPSVDALTPPPKGVLASTARDAPAPSPFAIHVTLTEVLMPITAVPNSDAALHATRAAAADINYGLPVPPLIELIAAYLAPATAAADSPPQARLPSREALGLRLTKPPPAIVARLAQFALEDNN